jgi:3'-phosphoadenosine 5'-phosphosulfate sulfotransferase (PAPS reductase)/FAD synthetase
LAELYGVETKNLNRQVKRNTERFPQEFMFQLSKDEKAELVTNWHRFNSLKHSSVLPYAFTEHGVAMLSSVLNSKRAIQVNIIIIKTFMKLREIISLHKELARKLSQLERKYERHDEQIHAIFDQIREFMTYKNKPVKEIGFKPE